MLKPRHGFIASINIKEKCKHERKEYIFTTMIRPTAFR
jgi:hypothetical protein